MPSRTASPGASPSSTAPAPAPWRSGSPMPGTPSSARCRSAPSRWRPRSARWNSTFRRSRASAAACSTSSTATATGARSTTSISSGPASGSRSPQGVGLYYIDHLTHNVQRGNMDVWADFYEKLFNFRQIRFFDIEGKHTGLFSKALTSPGGKIRIPINESADEKSQIEEYLKDYKGEGIQHVACGCRDIYETVATLRGQRARRSCRRRRTPTTTRWTSACPTTASRWSVCGSGPADRRRGRRRWRPDQGAAADLLQERDRPDLLRVHPAQGRRGLRRGQLQGPVREIEEDQIRRGVLEDRRRA